MLSYSSDDITRQACVDMRYGDVTAIAKACPSVSIVRYTL
jgi:hypothetical protein